MLFFYGHWLLHQDVFYSTIHKIHHEFKEPVGLVAAYCHPVEMFVANLIPLTAGMLLLRCHILTAVVILVFAVMGTEMHHCGYRLPWQLSSDIQPDFHDFHHEKFTTNYGLTGWLDRLHGTVLAGQVQGLITD